MHTSEASFFHPDMFLLFSVFSNLSSDAFLLWSQLQGKKYVNFCPIVFKLPCVSKTQHLKWVNTAPARLVTPVLLMLQSMVRAKHLNSPRDATSSRQCLPLECMCSGEELSCINSPDLGLGGWRQKRALSRAQGLWMESTELAKTNAMSAREVTEYLLWNLTTLCL